MDTAAATIDTPTLDDAPQQPTSIADHQAAFGPSGTGQPLVQPTTPDPAPAAGEPGETPAERDERGRFRHRAASQQAGPEDVNTINTLTKELRTKEQELSTLDPEGDKDSPRIRVLKRQIAAVDAAILAKKAPKSPEPTREPPRVPAAPTAFTDKEPQIEDFQNDPDPYGAHLLAKGRWLARKEAAELAQTQAQQQFEAREREIGAKHMARWQAFMEKTPDFQAVTQNVAAMHLPPVLFRAIVIDDNGPQYVYTLAKDSAFLDELLLLTDGKPVSDALVAATQRRLKQHAQAASTGSAAVARPVYTPPRPPNPVRTGPIKTADDPPDEAGSIAEHAKFHAPKRR
jgi:hypothetical protein